MKTCQKQPTGKYISAQLVYVSNSNYVVNYNNQGKYKIKNEVRVCGWCMGVTKGNMHNQKQVETHN